LKLLAAESSVHSRSLRTHQSTSEGRERSRGGSGSILLATAPGQTRGFSPYRFVGPPKSVPLKPHDTQKTPLTYGTAKLRLLPRSHLSRRLQSSRCRSSRVEHLHYSSERTRCYCRQVEAGIQIRTKLCSKPKVRYYLSVGK